MSRFIRNAGTPATSGVDLSTCEINTSQSITANCFIGSGKVLCDTRWDLICSYTYRSGCVAASSFAIDLPIDNYNEFDLTVKGICNICCNTCMWFSLANCSGAITNVCVMRCCCLAFDASSSIGYSNITPNSYNCFVIYPDSICSIMQIGDEYYFNIKLRQVPCANTTYKNGVLIEYCNYAINVPCFKEREYKVSAPGCTTVNIAWDSSIQCCCRLHSIFFCANSNCPFDFADSCFTLYGWNNSLDNYSRLGG